MKTTVIPTQEQKLVYPCLLIGTSHNERGGDGIIIMRTSPHYGIVVHVPTTTNRFIIGETVGAAVIGLFDWLPYNGKVVLEN